MVARLGKVLYWATCLAAVCWLAAMFVLYPGVDTTGIEAARHAGTPDREIYEQQKQKLGSVFKFDEAAKVYSQTEILTHLVSSERSRFAVPERDQILPFSIAVGIAFAIWLTGRAFRYVMAGY